MAPRVSVVINFFNPDALPRISTMVSLAMECLAAYTEYPLELILVDGSGRATPPIAELCSQRGWIYQQCPHKGAFAKIYNQGMQAATGDYRVWMASDIFVTRGWETKLISEIQRTGAWMAAPYLTNSDYPSQTYNWPLKMRTFAPSLMTFNLNMITPRCFEAVGGMDERFSGNFNDTDYLLRIRQAGGDAIIVDCGQIAHLARATSAVASTFRYDEDQTRFLEKYPQLRQTRPGAWGAVDMRSMCRSSLYRALIEIAYSAPKWHRINERIMRSAMRLEPILSRV